MAKIKECIENKQEYYFVDTGYISSQITRYPEPKILDEDKTYFRICKGSFHTNKGKVNTPARLEILRKKLGTDLAIAVTGNAGPTTDNNNKAVGLVYIALASEEGVAVAEFNFGKPREKVIERTVNKSLEIVLKNLLKKE